MSGISGIGWDGRWAAMLCVLVAGAPTMTTANDGKSGTKVLEWSRLPPIPDPIGFAQPYAGVSDNKLIVAGGSNFPVGRPWTGDPKVWHDRIFILDLAAAKPDWKVADEKLPRPLAHGASVTGNGGVICIGGGDKERHYAEVFVLRHANGKIERQELPNLPTPVAFCAAVILDNALYVAGGIEKPDSAVTGKNFWMLDLARPDAKWESLPAWDGPGRMLATMGAQDGSVFVFSGTDLKPSQDGKQNRTHLVDAHRYSPKSREWKKVADLPHAAVAAPSPAAAIGPTHLLVLGGDDGANFFKQAELKDDHPGFQRDILAYHAITNTWAKRGEIPASFAVAPAVFYQDKIIVPNGEARPGVRTNVVEVAEPIRTKASFGLLNWIALVGYLAGMLLIGYYFADSEKSTNEYFLGGQNVPWWAAGLSVFATVLSSLTFMALPAKVYASDWTLLLWNLGGAYIAPIVVFYYLPFFRRLNVTSAYEYLERRFSLIVRLLASANFVLLQIGRMAIVLYLPAMALATISDINVFVCIVLMGLLCTVYVVMGGVEAVIWTDVVQSILLLGSVLLSIVIVISKLNGGVGELLDVALADDKLKAVHWTMDPRQPALWVVIFGSMLFNLMPYTADQAVVQRYLTTKDELTAARSIWTNAVLVLIASLLFFVLGTCLYVYYKQLPTQLDPTIKTDAIFPLFILDELPAGLGGLVIAGLFAAAQSTLSGSINSVATAIVTDFYRRFKPHAEDKVCMKLAIRISLILGVASTGVAMLMATVRIESLFELFIQLLGMLGGGLAGIFALGIFTRRANAAGALIGAAASIATVYFVEHSSLSKLTEGGAAVLSCFIVGYIASLVIPLASKNLAGLTIHDMAKPVPATPAVAPAT